MGWTGQESINPSQLARARWRNSTGLQPSHISLIWHRRTQQFTAHISRKSICCIQFNTTIPLNYLYHLMSGSISLIKIVRLAKLSLCFFQLELLWIVGGFKEQQSGDQTFKPFSRLAWCQVHLHMFHLNGYGRGLQTACRLCCCFFFFKWNIVKWMQMALTDWQRLCTFLPSVYFLHRFNKIQLNF